VKSPLGVKSPDLETSKKKNGGRRDERIGYEIDDRIVASSLQTCREDWRGLSERKRKGGRSQLRHGGLKSKKKKMDIWVCPFRNRIGMRRKKCTHWGITRGQEKKKKKTIESTTGMGSRSHEAAPVWNVQTHIGPYQASVSIYYNCTDKVVKGLAEKGRSRVTYESKPSEQVIYVKKNEAGARRHSNRANTP